MNSLILELRGNKATHFVFFDTIWDLPWMKETTSSQNLAKLYNEIHTKDPEKIHHSPELYAVWNSKPWMLKTALELNPFNSSFFYWMDIGSIRKPWKKLGRFPDVKKAIEIFGSDIK